MIERETLDIVEQYTDGWKCVDKEYNVNVGTLETEVAIVDMAKKAIDRRDIQTRLEAHYREDPGGRQFHFIPIADSYFNIGTVMMTLEGSPPKGYAIYQSGAQKVVFLDVKLRPYEVWRNVTLNIQSAAD